MDFLSRDHGFSIVDEKVSEADIELEEPMYTTPFGGLADRVHVNYKEEVFSALQTLGAT